MRLSEAVLTEELDRIIASATLRIGERGADAPTGSDTPNEAVMRTAMAKGLRRLKHYRAQFAGE